MHRAAQPGAQLAEGSWTRVSSRATSIGWYCAGLASTTQTCSAPWMRGRSIGWGSSG
jgi:hypothetical protein